MTIVILYTFLHMLEWLISKEESDNWKELFILSTRTYELSWGNIKEERTDLQMYKKKILYFSYHKREKKGMGERTKTKT